MGGHWQTSRDYFLCNTNLDEEYKYLSKIIGTISCRNTRSKILKDFPQDAIDMGLFPNVIKNDAEYNLDNRKQNEIIKILDKMPLAYYNILSYIKPEIANETGMIGIYRTFLFKRMDSSIKSFKRTINNSIERITKFIEEGKYTFDNTEYDITQYNSLIQDLETDLEYFKQINIIADGLDDSLKLQLLKDSLQNRKTIIFTEYLTTMELISDFLVANNYKVISFSGKSTAKDLDVIIKDFDPSSDKQTNKYDILVCTDTLSEGVSLHKSNHVIHFDQKWNPSKMIQREGRINRIGGTHENVYVTTFSVPNLIERLIDLEGKISIKNSFQNILFKFMEYPIVLKKNVFDENRLYGQYKHHGYFFRTNQGDMVSYVYNRYKIKTLKTSQHINTFIEGLDDSEGLPKSKHNPYENIVEVYFNNKTNSDKNFIYMKCLERSGYENSKITNPSFIKATNSLYSNIICKIVDDYIAEYFKEKKGSINTNVLFKEHGSKMIEGLNYVGDIAKVSGYGYIVD